MHHSNPLVRYITLQTPLFVVLTYSFGLATIIGGLGFYFFASYSTQGVFFGILSLVFSFIFPLIAITLVLGTLMLIFGTIALIKGQLAKKWRISLLIAMGVYLMPVFALLAMIVASQSPSPISF